MKINIVDAGCGVGKTTALINKINEDITPCKYLFITPFLSEVDRVIRCCPKKKFVAPTIDEDKTKHQNITKLFEKGRNIVSTHALFKNFDDKIIENVKKYHYILIVDEMIEVIEDVKISQYDIRLLDACCVETDKKTHLVKWTDNKYNGKLNEYRDLIKQKNIYAYTDEENHIISLMWVMPYRIFQAFKSVYLLTYMFDGQIQKKYFDFFGTQYARLYVKDFHLTYKPQQYDYSKQKALINVCQSDKLNEIGENRTALSKNWFQTNLNTDSMTKLQKNITNFFRSHTEAHSNELLWTTFKQYKNNIQDKGYIKSFESLNCRATNAYQHKKAVAYVANRFCTPTIKNFFQINDIDLDKKFEDAFALSELVQFVYRSAIRNNQPIDVYIPSKRMRELFMNWLTKKNE